jgi:hypothetical protein
MKTNDFVVLSKKAIKDFYGRPNRIEDFAVGGNPENLSSEQVIDFIDSYLGFENGKAVGIIASIENDTARVIFNCLIKKDVDFSYYNVKDLKVVKVRVV